MSVSDNTIQVEGLGDFFKSFGKKGLKVSKTMAKNILKTQDELWIIHQTLLLQMFLETPNRLYQHSQN